MKRVPSLPGLASGLAGPVFLQLEVDLFHHVCLPSMAAKLCTASNLWQQCLALLNDIEPGLGSLWDPETKLHSYSFRGIEIFFFYSFPSHSGSFCPVSESVCWLSSWAEDFLFIGEKRPGKERLWVFPRCPRSPPAHQKGCLCHLLSWPTWAPSEGE